MMDIIWIFWKWVGIAIVFGSVLAVIFFDLIGVMMFINYK